jgi:tripartite-type tricarboxylate transporter receptor subunit TctC
MRWATRLGLSILIVALALPALAQGWPNRPVRIVVPFGRVARPTSTPAWWARN